MLVDYLKYAERGINRNDNLSFESLFVTPDYAKELLNKNISNRPLTKTHVLSLSKSILNGEWKVTGEPIKFSKNGNLIDGQHRLAAIILADQGIQLSIIRNIDNSAFDVIDIGRPRRISDILAIMKISNSSAVAAGIRVFIAFKKLNPNGSPSLQEKTSAIDVERVISRSKNYEHWAFLANSDRYKKIIPTGLSMGLGMIFSEKSDSYAHLFFEKLISGEGLSAKDPILTLRDRLISNKSSTLKLPQAHLAFFIVKAWNASRSNKKLTILKISENESFPLVL
jgi:hypothetical protein